MKEMSKEFKWDDKSIEEMLVRAFSERMFQGLLKTPKQVIEDYKASHSTEDRKPEWEIIGFSHQSGTMHDARGRCGCPILSVRRLSDNSVWAVGDTVEAKYWGSQVITGFSIEDGEMLINFGTCRNQLSCISKLPQRTKLFTTEDGVDVFKGDNVWFYEPISHSINIIWNLNKYVIEPRYKYFSTKEKATEYLLMNKPLLSVQDFENFCKKKNWFAYDLYTKELKELAKSKL